MDKSSNTLSDIPFIAPTAVLSYSLLLFGISRRSFAAFWLFIRFAQLASCRSSIFHVFLSIVVRGDVDALMDYKIEYEQASRTLGAPPLTTARTVTLGI